MVTLSIVALYNIKYTFKMAVFSIENLFEAIRLNKLEMVATILKEYPSWVNVHDHRGSTPLILSAYYNHREMVTLLLSNNVDVNGRDASGNTALMGVCFKGYEDIARILIEAGAQINAVNSNGASALVYAVTFNQIGLVRLLLKNNADKTITDTKGILL